MLIYVEFDGVRLYSSALVHMQPHGSLWGSVPFGGGALFRPVLAQHHECTSTQVAMSTRLTSSVQASCLMYVIKQNGFCDGVEPLTSTPLTSWAQAEWDSLQRQLD